MSNILYVHAYFTDLAVQRDLRNFYPRILQAGPDGLTKIQGVLTKEELNRLASGQEIGLQSAVKEHDFRGLGIWTEWAGASHIDRFYQSPLHREFAAYAQQTLDKGWYRIVQLRDGKISVRDVK